MKLSFHDTYRLWAKLNNRTRGQILRHNNLRNFEADMLSKKVNDVETEPKLQPVTSEIIEGLSRNASKPDISAKGAWRAGQNAFFNVSVANTHSPSQIHLTTETVLKKHEQEKKRNYNRRIINIERGTFTPLVFSAKDKFLYRHCYRITECYRILHSYL